MCNLSEVEYRFTQVEMEEASLARHLIKFDWFPSAEATATARKPEQQSRVDLVSQLASPSEILMRM